MEAGTDGLHVTMVVPRIIKGRLYKNPSSAWDWVPVEHLEVFAMPNSSTYPSFWNRDRCESAHTDAEGRFEIRNLRPDTYDLVVRQYVCYGPEEKLAVFVAKAPGTAAGTDNVKLRLELCLILGTVLDETGEVIPGARVIARPILEDDRQPHESSIQEAVTAETGRFIIIGVKDRLYAVTAAKEGYTAVSEETRVLGGPKPTLVRIVLRKVE